MAQNSDIPKSVRIRTGDGNEHRFDAIERAADYYDCNRSDAVANACNDVPRMMRALRSVLERDDLTLQQRRDIAQEFDSVIRGVEITVDLELKIDLEEN